MFLRTKALKGKRVLVIHKKIHLRQQMELRVIPFYITYVFEFLIRFIRYKDWNMAYRNSSFEREAYKNEKDLEYLKSRPFFHRVNRIRK
jgi:hypothetical protein